MSEEIIIKPTKYRDSNWVTTDALIFGYHSNVSGHVGEKLRYSSVIRKAYLSGLNDVPSYCKRSNTLFTNNKDAEVINNVLCKDIKNIIILLNDTKDFWLVNTVTKYVQGCIPTHIKELGFPCNDKGKKFHIIYNLYKEN